MQIFEEEGNSKDFLMDPYFSVEETEWAGKETSSSGHFSQ
jgi:hypothetical protein